MSFSSEVKEELAKQFGRSRHCQIAALANELYKRLSQKKNREYGLKIEHRDIGKDALRGK